MSAIVNTRGDKTKYFIVRFLFVILQKHDICLSLPLVNVLTLSYDRQSNILLISNVNERTINITRKPITFLFELRIINYSFVVIWY